MGDIADLYDEYYDEEDRDGLTMHDRAQEKINNTTNNMKTAIVQQVIPGKPWTNDRGTYYSWWVGLDNGDRISVNTKKNIAPWNEGEEAHYEIRETVPGKNGKGPWHKAKKVRPEGAPGSSYAPSSPRGGGQRNDRSITIQAMLKSVIESGASATLWKQLTQSALKVHDELLLDAQASAPAPQPEQPKPAPAPAPVAVAEDEDDLPF